MTITANDLPGILEKHSLWLCGEPGGVRADLTRANLTRANLTKANLTKANLTRANLTGANLFGANLTETNLTRANLEGAYLTGANLTGAYLTETYLTRTNLNRAYLTGANLTGANLTRANLTKANLTRSALIGNRPIFQMGPIGSEDRYIVAYNTGSGIKIMAGCFFGTLAAFLEKVEKTHGPNRHGRDYRAAVAMIETFFSEVLP